MNEWGEGMGEKRSVKEEEGIGEGGRFCFFEQAEECKRGPS